MKKKCYFEELTVSKLMIDPTVQGSLQSKELKKLLVVLERIRLEY